MDQNFDLEELRLLYSLVHECIYVNNHQLDNDKTISAETRNDIVDENKTAWKCYRKLRPIISDISPSDVDYFSRALPSLR